MIKLNFLILLTLAVFMSLTGCKSKKEISKKPNKALKKAPQWVQQTPTDSLYFYGIGGCPVSKDSTHFNVAKQMALSEIFKQVIPQEANFSLTNYLTKKYKLTTAIDTNAFWELFKTYAPVKRTNQFTSRVEHWVLYRIGKNDFKNWWRDIKQKRIKEAFQIYQASKATNNLNARLNQLALALDTTRFCWNQALIHEGNNLANLIPDELNTISEKITINRLSDQVFNLKNNFKQTLTFRLLYPENGQLKGMAKVLTKIQVMDEQVELYSDQLGKINHMVTIADFDKTEGNIELIIIPASLIDKPVVNNTYMLVDKLTEKKLLTTWELIPPSVFIISSQNNLSFLNPIKQKLLTGGLTISNAQKNADIVLYTEIETYFEEKSSMHCFKSLLLVAKNKAGKIIFEYQVPFQEGVGKTKQASENTASDLLKKAIEQLNNNFMLNALNHAN